MNTIATVLLLLVVALFLGLVISFVVLLVLHYLANHSDIEMYEFDEDETEKLQNSK